MNRTVSPGAIFAYSRRALDLVWTTSRSLSLLGIGLTVLAGVLPAVIAWIGAQIVDAVVRAARHRAGR